MTDKLIEKIAKTTNPDLWLEIGAMHPSYKQAFDGYLKGLHENAMNRAASALAAIKEEHHVIRKDGLVKPLVWEEDKDTSADKAWSAFLPNDKSGEFYTINYSSEYGWGVLFNGDEELGCNKALRSFEDCSDVVRLHHSTRVLSLLNLEAAQ